MTGSRSPFDKRRRQMVLIVAWVMVIAIAASALGTVIAVNFR